MYIVTVVSDPNNYVVGTQYVALTIEQFGPIVQGQMPAGDATATAMNSGQPTCWSNVFNPTNNTYINSATADEVSQLYIDCNL
jgi:hypothetical protein